MTNNNNISKNRLEMLNYVAENIYDKVKQESFIHLLNWIGDRGMDAQLQLLTIHSESSILGYVVRDSMEYFVIYYDTHSEFDASTHDIIQQLMNVITMELTGNITNADLANMLETIEEDFDDGE